MIRTVTSRGSGAALAAAARSHASNNYTRRLPAHESLSTLSGHTGTSTLFCGNPSSSRDQSDQEAERKRMAQINPIRIAANNNSDSSSSHNTYHQLQTHRSYHVTAATQRGGPALALGLASVAAVAKAGQYASRAFEQYKIEAAAAAEEEAQRRKEAGLPSEEEERAQAEAEAAKAKTDGGEGNKKKKADDGRKENIFNTFFNMGVGSKFYEGGFEEEMTRREAALILGVRESSAPKRIKEAHRKLLVLNHPDTGGSTYIAGKINEAKELLLKGRKA